MQGITTQLDLAPAILNSLSQRYEMPVSEKAAWLGEGFSKDGKRTADRPSPLYKAQGGAYAWIVGDALVEKKRMRAISAEATLLEATETPKEIRDLISGFEARESYVLENNALIPNETVLFEKLILPPSKTELVWIHSVFNGKDYDGAYETARDLAFSGQRDRAKLLCRYILMQVPGHVDSEILLGRIHAWEKEYARAIEILEQVVQKHPVYEDGYAALLDVYFWSGQSEKAQFLWPVIREHLKSHPALEGKLRRAGIQTDTAAADNRSMSQQIVQIHFE